MNEIIKQGIVTNIKAELDVLNASLKAIGNDENGLLGDLLSYALVNSGKRIRPMLVILGASLGNPHHEHVQSLGLAVELIHVATLVHDDIIDRDDKRRNAPSFHIKFQEFYKQINDQDKAKIRRFGESVAILAGNILYELGLEIIYNLQIPDEIKSKLIELYAATYRKVNEGQLLDIDFEKS